MASARHRAAAGESCGAGKGVGIVCRHLTHAQKTIVALELLPELEAEARKRQATSTGGAAPQLIPPMGEAGKSKHSTATDKAAAIVGVCGSSVQQAKAVNRLAPLLCIPTRPRALLSHVLPTRALPVDRSEEHKCLTYLILAAPSPHP